MKKIKLIVILLSMLSSLVVDASVKIGNIYYDLSGTEASVVYNGAHVNLTGDVTIPSTVNYNGNAYTVTSIDDGAFEECNKITSISIPESVVLIGQAAFYGCNGLTKAQFASVESLVTINMCNKTSNPLAYAHKLYIDNELVTELIIPDVKSIGNYALYSCTSISSVRLNSSVLSIGMEAFMGCTNLLTLVVPDNAMLRSIAVNAFKGCSSLTSVTIPTHVESIGNEAFTDVKNLTIMSNSIASKDYTSAENLSDLFGIELTKITYTSNVKRIGSYSFYGLSLLENIIVDDSIVSIGRILSGINNSPWYSNLPSGSIIYLGKVACGYKAPLTKIEIEEGILGIADYAFNGSNYNITIPNSVICIGEESLPGSWEGSQPDGVLYAGSVAYKYKGIMPNNANIIIKDGVLNLHKDLFQIRYKERLTSISLPESLTTIESGVFAGCTGLTSISIPENVAEIGADAFQGCIGLERADFVSSDRLFYMEFENAEANPLYNAHYLYVDNKRVKSVITPSLTDINPYTLVGCSLHSLTISSDVKIIGENAFTADSIKKTFWLPDLVPEGHPECAIGKINYHQTDHYSGLGTNFYRYELLERARFEVDGIVYVRRTGSATCDVIDCNYSHEPVSVNIGASVPYNNGILTVRNIMPYACYDDDRITGGIMVSNQGYVGEYAFYNCSKAQGELSVSNVGYVGDYAFYNCLGLTNGEISNNGIIKTYAFSKCTGFQTLHVENNGYIGEHAFSNCNIAGTAVVENNGDIHSAAFSNTGGYFSATINNKGYLGGGAFSSNLIKDLTITDQVTSILSTCFWHSSIKNNAVINNMGDIYNSAFSNCSGGFSATINNAGSLGNSAFLKSEMTSVSITNNVTSIGNKCFSEGSIAEQVTIENSGSIGEYAFSKISGGFDTYIRSNGPLPLSCFKESIMQNVEIGNGVTSIGDSCFQSSYFKQATIGNQVGSIGDYGFENATGFTNLVIPDNVKDVGVYAFSKCTTMENITLSRGMKKIAEGDFSGCTALASLFVPNNINSIDNNTFDNCPVLCILTLEDKDGEYTLGLSVNQSENAPLFATCGLDSVYVGGSLNYLVKQKPYSPFHSHSSLRAIRFTDVEHQIYDREFEKCMNLQEVYLGAKIDTIGHYAFGECSAMEHFTVGPAVTVLGRYSFSYCSVLKDINLANTVRIKENSFTDCTSLPQINIPQSTLSIGDSTFVNCTALKFVFIQDRTNVLALGKNLPNCNYKGLEGVGTPLFADCPLDSVYIGGPISYSDLKENGYSPFFYHESLRSVFITNKEETVYNYEFWNCRGLQRIKLGNGVKTIMEKGFYDCKGLVVFEFASTLQSIGKEAFSECKNVESVISHAETPPVCGENAIYDLVSASLYIPEGSEEAYRNADQWMEFFFDGQIIPMTLATSITLNKTVLLMSEIGNSSVLTATVGPSGVFDGSVTWKSDNLNVVTVGSTGLVTAIGYGTAIITATTNDGTNLSATCTVTVGNVLTPGDLNNDGEVDITDIILIIDVMSGQITDVEKKTVADINNDGEVDITDIIGAIDLMISQNASSSTMSKAPVRQQTSDYIEASIRGKNIDVSLENQRGYSAFQMMVYMPDGLTLTGAKLNKQRSDSHQLLVRQIGNGQYLVMGFSLGNDVFAGHSGNLLTLTTDGHAVGDIVVEDVLFGTPDAQGYHLAGLTINPIPTGISELNCGKTGESDVIYDLQGRRISTPAKGVYIINGKKVIRK